MNTLQISLTHDGSHEQLTFGELLARSPQTLLYFYPKDDTPGCTLEAQDFTRLQDDFRTFGIQII
jgi:thioredoxin-dependent peroxiredoxin